VAIGTCWHLRGRHTAFEFSAWHDDGCPSYMLQLETRELDSFLIIYRNGCVIGASFSGSSCDHAGLCNSADNSVLEQAARREQT
jgi:hypothetical protein